MGFKEFLRPAVRPSFVGCSVALVLLIALGAVALWLISNQMGPGGLLPALVMASLPVPLYVGLALWVDRYEPEPPTLLLGAFLLGASVAAIVSYWLNSANTLWFYSNNGDVDIADDLGTIFSAPFVEEFSKAVCLWLLFFYRRKDFDGVVDGVIYATMIALGFAMTENIQYYGQALKEGGSAGATQTFLLRGILSPYAHPLFTSMTGIGLGWACENERKGFSWLAPLGGLGLAILLHGAWNLTAAIHAKLWLLTYALFMLPCAVGVIVVLRCALEREGAWLRRYLKKEMPGPELDRVSSIRGRVAYSLRNLLRQGPRGWYHSEQYLQVASQLAFLRRRVEERGHDPQPTLDAQLKQQMHQLKAGLDRQWARPRE